MVLQAVTKEQQIQAASYICTAHDIVVSSPYALFVTHNDFQAPFTQDRTGLVPRWTGVSILHCAGALEVIYHRAMLLVKASWLSC